MSKSHYFLVLVGILTLVAPATPVHADLALETETARLVLPGKFELGTAFEFQTSTQGQEIALPVEFEVGLVKNLELKVEPVAYTAILPSQGRNASGLGDLEVTLLGLVLKEKGGLPAVAVAGEVKIPTARNNLIGTQQTDGTIYLIASKQLGHLDLHTNIGYTFVGQPSGVSLKNTFNLALAGEYRLNRKFDLLAEGLYTTSSASSGSGEIGSGAAGDLGRFPLVPEASGSELIGTAGVRYHLQPNIDLFTTGSYDNNNAFLVRTGVNWKF